MQSERSTEAQAKSCHRSIQLACETIIREIQSKNKWYILARKKLGALTDKNEIKTTASNFIYKQFYFKALDVLYSYAMSLLPTLIFALRHSSCFEELKPAVLNVVSFAPLIRDRSPELFTARTILLSIWKNSLMENGEITEKDKLDIRLKIYLDCPELEEWEVMGYAQLMLKDQVGSQVEHWIDKWCEEKISRHVTRNALNEKEGDVLMNSRRGEEQLDRGGSFSLDFPFHVRGIIKTDLKGQKWFVNHYGLVLVNKKDAVYVEDGDVAVATIKTGADGQKRAAVLSRSSCCFFCLDLVSKKFDLHSTCSGGDADSTLDSEVEFQSSHVKLGVKSGSSDEETNTNLFKDQVDTYQALKTWPEPDFEGELEWDDDRQYGFVVHPTLPWVIGVIPAEQVPRREIGKIVPVYITGPEKPEDGKLYCALNPTIL